MHVIQFSMLVVNCDPCTLYAVSSRLFVPPTPAVVATKCARWTRYDSMCLNSLWCGVQYQVLVPGTCTGSTGSIPVVVVISHVHDDDIRNLKCGCRGTRFLDRHMDTMQQGHNAMPIWNVWAHTWTWHMIPVEQLRPVQPEKGVMWPLKHLCLAPYPLLWIQEIHTAPYLYMVHVV